MSAQTVDRVVLGYLQKKGYDAAARELQKDSRFVGASTDSVARMAYKLAVNQDVSISNYISFHYSAEASNPDRYDEGYTALAVWVENSLDKYRLELRQVLYPVFVLCFLELFRRQYFTKAKDFFLKHVGEHKAQNSEDLKLLECFLGTSFDPALVTKLLDDNIVSSKFLKSKYNIRMCRYVFEILVAFLHEGNHMVILSILNGYTNIKVTSEIPSGTDIDISELAQTGEDSTPKELATKWSNLKLSVPDVENWLLRKQRIIDDAAARDVEMKKTDGQAIEESAPKRQKMSDDVFLSKSLKDDSATTPIAPVAKTLANAIPSDVASMPQLSADAEKERIEDLRHRASLESNTPPSVMMVTLLNSHRGLNHLEMGRNGAVVAGAFGDSTIRLWDLKVLMSKQSDAQNTLATALKRSQLGFGPQLASGTTLLAGHAGPVYSVKFSPDGEFLISGSQDGTARLWSIATESTAASFKGHMFPVWDVQFSPYGSFFATASQDKTARLWSTDRPFPLRLLAGHMSDVNGVEFHQNGNYVATVSDDRTARLWDVNTGSCVRLFTGHTAAVSSIAFSPDGSLLATGAENGIVCLWDIGEGTKICTFEGHSGPVHSLDFCQGGGSVLASGSSDCTVRLWDVSKARLRPGSKQICISPLCRTTMDPAAPVTIKKADVNVISELFASGPTADLPVLPICLPTKSTPVLSVRFTHRNLLLAGGSFDAIKE